ncbi:flagellar basal body P-ring formation chaperone FlgA [Robbsia andropogonis]|uniref:flagellar basal body P-ring formation chaperone FlgA n=1 Tax=Robbsia andropogonis TaxID=28092 RepID=UPI00046748DF|nr:flagellar basal body P-ring formation chaperone FlgA [Robbsia andropogonis]MCP1118749.1 flagellar basal body P-ring formation chaperone FlgA [Robbsia andropogonis]MCP1128216.1 flagellar basal body P-ring formation chaperone FlgA [Robbsia andropogonis]
MRAATPVHLIGQTLHALFGARSARFTRTARRVHSGSAAMAAARLTGARSGRTARALPVAAVHQTGRSPLSSGDAWVTAAIMGVAAALLGVAPHAHAQAASAQDPALIVQAAERFLVQQTEGLPGRVTIAVTPPQPQGLAACPALEAFLPSGTRMWGKVMVGVRCTDARPWTIYVQARVGIIGNYYVASHGLNPNTVIGPNDLMVQNGDLTTMPTAIVTDPTQILGTTTMNAVMAGMPLRTDSVRAAVAIHFGQIVKLIAQGNGFAISSEGSAMANASAGQQVKVRTANGAIVSGIAQPDSSVNIPL